ncbi:unnamed protein product [Orchesella dallaii]|uniref:Arrestin C-terminal-like domain-containing protein n=1 Tax=Orchesella dallaii TaxID=48710 RepID=A0ABP1RJL0_9HEXA
MVLHCAIHLERDPAVYQPGDMVEGIIVISSTWADKLTGVSIKLVKKMEVDWNTSKLYDKSRTGSVDDVQILSECEILDAGGMGDSHSHSSSKKGVTVHFTNTAKPTPIQSAPPPLITPSTNSEPKPSTSKAAIAEMEAANKAAAAAAASAAASSAATSSSSAMASFSSKRGIVVTRGVTHRYPFLLKIDYLLDLPSTFHGTFGYIAYKLVAFIKVAKKGIFIGTMKDIGIFPILDLNHLDLSLQRPADEKRVFKSLFGYNYVFMKVHMDKKAFLPEELVGFTVEVTNKSPAPLDGVEVYLNMSTYFGISGNRKIESKTLLRIRGPCIAQGEHGIWSHSFNFPAYSIPTGLGALSRMSNKFIDLQYVLQFSLEVSKAEKFFIPFPIVIGTVPYGRNVVRLQHMHENDNAHQNQHQNQVPAQQSQQTQPQPGPSHSRHHHHHSHYHYNSSSGGGSSSSTSASYSPEYEYENHPHHQQHYSTTSTIRSRPRSKSTSALPPSYSAANLHSYALRMRRAETPPPTYHEARTLATT